MFDMNSPTVARSWNARALLAALALLPATSAIAGTDLDFDRTFNVDQEPPQLHFKASYRVGGQDHAIEVWRDGDRRLRRRTDDAIETVVSRPANDSEWHMQVFDLKRGTRTSIDRTNLIRIGHFVDWFGLSHGLARPVGAYVLTDARPPAKAVSPLSNCNWYALGESRICWSRALGVPMLITDAQGEVQWRITQANAKPLGDQAFAVAGQGFVHNDANADIQGD